MRAGPSLLASLLAGALAALAGPADATCKKFGFTVNDYGKEGPTNDAKNLLDKHIAEWAAQNKVTEYQTGKKNVSCELFLDVVLFDEHTCTASATVCWGPGVKPNNTTGGEASAPADDTGAGHPPKPVRKAEALGTAPQQAATPPAADASSAPAAQAAAPAAETPAATGAPTAPTAPADQAAATADGPPVALTPQATPPATGAGLETGALQAGQGLAPSAAQKATPSEKERAAAAAAAASAAAAAERAAMAAETAANAAKEAAAAAVAASAASKGTATVPPLDHASGAKPAHTE